MTSEFIPMDLALRLKALGFNEPCFGYYKAEYEDGVNPLPVNLILEQNKASSNVFYKTSAPLYQQAFRWFRRPENGSYNHLDFMYEYLKDDSITYEEAELECLKKLIEIVESKTE
jgi:hypothetical protein